jgi:hypothetical protein
MRRRLAAIAALAVLCGSAARAQQAAAPAAPGASTWFAQAMTHSESGLNVTYFWSLGAQLRAPPGVAGPPGPPRVCGDTH